MYIARLLRTGVERHDGAVGSIDMVLERPLTVSRGRIGRIVGRSGSGHRSVRTSSLKAG